MELPVSLLVPLAVGIVVIFSVNSAVYLVLKDRPNAPHSQPKLSAPHSRPKLSAALFQIRPPGKCNVSDGEWVRSNEEPLYTNASCSFIQYPQNCIANGKPDKGYLYWKWKPKSCNLQQFNAIKFLQIMRGKKMAFVGDSNGRSQMQSLLCMISQVEMPYSAHNNGDQQDVDYRDTKWYFPSYNFTLAMFWSPFLVKVSEMPFKHGEGKLAKLHLDIPQENWAKSIEEYSMLVFSAGYWFYSPSIYESNGHVMGCHVCDYENVTKVDPSFGYRSAFESIFKYVTTTPRYHGISVLRTFTVEHFENGTWDHQGTCPRTQPFSRDEVTLPDSIAELYKIQIEEFQKINVIPNGSKLKLLDVTYSSLLRPDGHPGPYRQIGPLPDNAPNDCMHWCLPGPVDTWNSIILKMLEEG